MRVSLLLGALARRPAPLLLLRLWWWLDQHLIAPLERLRRREAP